MPVKKLVVVCISIAIFFIFFRGRENTASAHGGVQKQNDRYIVTYYQKPLSPFVGEEVKTTFLITDKALKRKSGVEGSLTLVDTYPDDESKDVVILTQTFKSDVNGAFEFAHTFDKENYFNIELTFEDLNESQDHVDFLIQVRKPLVPQIQRVLNKFNFRELCLFLLGFLIGIAVFKMLFNSASTRTSKGK